MHRLKKFCWKVLNEGAPLWGPRRKSAAHIKMQFKDLGWKCVEWINLAQERHTQKAELKTKLNFWFVWHFFSSWGRFFSMQLVEKLFYILDKFVFSMTGGFLLCIWLMVAEWPKHVAMCPKYRQKIVKIL